ncbi:MAG: hypothetical protein GX620_12210 [Chloroflexi bacterium]|nr:hypothetical protein [Chloroflexota bacterium]
MSGPGTDREAYYLLKDVSRAINEFGLIAPGDRVAVAISGGKDSYALTHLLLSHQRKVPYQYELVAIHIYGSRGYPPDARPTLEPWLGNNGVAYRSVEIMFPPSEPYPPDCFRCSLNRRKALFQAAAELKCSKIAYGHNADDAASTTLLSLMYKGQLETMAPAVPFFGGIVTLIRPLIYIPENRLLRFARRQGFSEAPLCSQAHTSRRAQVKQLLNQAGHSRDQVRTNLWRAARRQMGF